MRAVRTFLVLAFIAGLLLSAGCQQYAASTPYEVIEGDHRSNYHRIFGESPPRDVDVLNSIRIQYAWRPFAVTTDDWEIELLATDSWIVRTTHNLHLVPLAADNTWVRNFMVERQTRRYRPWYAPKAFGAYDAYYLKPTSIPYVHMLVDREALPNGARRVYLSKH